MIREMQRRAEQFLNSADLSFLMNNFKFAGWKIFFEIILI